MTSATCPACRGDIATVDSVLAKRRTSTLVWVAVAIVALTWCAIVDFESAIGIIATLVILTLTVLVHEYGHLRAAQRAGVSVSEFAVGFGPVITARELNSGLVLSLRALPVGGFCRIAGMSPDDAWCERHNDAPDLLSSKPLRTQLWVMLAGVTNNVISAWVILCAVILIQAHEWTWRLILAPWYAAKLTVSLVVGTISGLGHVVTSLFVHHSTTGMTSVIGMPGQFNDMHAASQHTASGSGSGTSVWMLAAIFMVIVSISLAVMNVLPLAALDGGHVVMAIWNAVTQRRYGRGPSSTAVAAFQATTLVPFAAVMIFVMGRDIVHLF